MADKFDLVIIGGGNAGYVPAIRASQLGMSVSLIERREHLGGTCLNVGCIPTKALLQTAARLHDARNGSDFGVTVGQVEFDYAQAARRKDQVVDQLRQGVRGLMKKNKVQVFRGTESFIEAKRVKVQDGDDEATELEAANVLLATGSAVATLPGLELDAGKVISSDDVVTRTDDPHASVIVLGSGAVGVEFASLYNDFGTDVTLVELLDAPSRPRTPTRATRRSTALRSPSHARVRGTSARPQPPPLSTRSSRVADCLRVSRARQAVGVPR